MLSQGKDLKDDKVNAGAIKVKKNRLARQYMNRRGGFNRPLPAERTGEKVSHPEPSFNQVVDVNAIDDLVASFISVSNFFLKLLLNAAPRKDNC